MIKRLLGIATILLIGASVKAAGTTEFIAFNGGGGPDSNRQTFENQISLFNQSFFDGRGTLLNGGGANGKMLPVDRAGFTERNIFGAVKFENNKVPGIEATAENLKTTLDTVARQKPAAVTILYSDHGSPDAVGAWKEDVPYQTVQSFDAKFSEDTVVRRIHTHCFSGAALAPAGFKPETSDEPSFLKAYPKNRCAVSAALGSEYGYEVSLENWKALGRSPSLQDLKNSYVNDKDYVATPQLTSDYFVRDFYRKVCGQRRKVIACYADESAAAQVGRLKSVIDDNSCQKAAELEENISLFRDDFKTVTGLSDEVEGVQEKAAVAYAKRKYPAEYAAYRRGYEAREALIKCSKVPSAACKPNTEKWLKEARDPSADSFLERFTSMTRGPQWAKYPLIGYVKYGDDDDEYKRQVGLAYRAHASLVAGRPLNVGYADFLDRREQLRAALQRTQKEQSGYVEQFRKDSGREMLAALDRPENAAYKKRYLEIRACETSPINQDSTEPTKK